MGSGVGHSAVRWAAMPKTAVNKNGDALSPEDKIGSSGERLMPLPTGNAGRAQDHHEFQLGVLVAARADHSHDLGPFYFGENIGHASSLALV